ncbi:hypothetical protein CTA2_4446 [Colletotrichum tanaceti]|uniref:Uncharacterized protein n=1 Tax=Colletotrichum tanaceti TaxID=1306861 RepID=A0A4U6XPV8_9PEZI|nr:hypothetical protein CTA2_4455 [Colletotrichum tanaceti]KAJ0167099.1 hypothetical protein CTA2_4446 [Colletotrichum tanaceti]TKW57845.1 hypothetical protein CTA1_9806 [Colletotrichum tanaceti]
MRRFVTSEAVNFPLTAAQAQAAPHHRLFGTDSLAEARRNNTTLRATVLLLAGAALGLPAEFVFARIGMSAAVGNPSGTGPFPATVVQITFGNDAFAAQNDQGGRGA